MSIKSFLYYSCFKLHDKSPDKFSKLNMDAILLDLEDAVPMKDKEAARQTLKKYFNEIKEKVPHIAIRINSMKTCDGLKDLDFILNNKLGFDVILLSMVESEYEIEMVKKVLHESGIQSKVYALIETPLSIKNIDEIASKCDGLFYGGADYCSLLGTKISRKNIQIDYVCSRIINASKIYNIPAIDTPCFVMNDMDYLEKECIKGFVQGFSGKQAIHPQQLETINTSYSYSSRDIDWAQTVIDAYQDDGKGITKCSNVMIGPPFIKLAQKILDVE